MRVSMYLDLAVRELLGGDLSRLGQATDYDTCWAARLTNEDGTPAYPYLLEELSERQHEDGSWGSHVPYIHDRILSTLAVVLLLKKFGFRAADKARLSAGERYIWQHVEHLSQDVHPTVGFEMILPALLGEAREQGLELPYAQLKHYEEKRARKLSALPTGRLFEKRTTALWSLEAFSGDIDLEGAEDLLFEDGSMIGSPSATACLMDQTLDWRTRFPRSATHLESLLEQGEPGLPVMSECGIFLRAWVLYYLRHGGLLSGRESVARPHHEYLRDNFDDKGVGVAPDGFPDSDDTAVVLFVLDQAGYEVDGQCLLDFERDEHFAVFAHETQPSISANLHVLEAVATLPEQDQARVRNKTISYILKERQPGGYWGDKWHASMYYPTSKALMALLPYAPDEMDDSLAWLLSTQRADGSWGRYTPTAEETALALIPLLLYYRAGWQLPEEAMRKGARYLLASERPFNDDYPELWTAKTLYAPTPVVRSIIFAALGLYEDIFAERLS